MRIELVFAHWNAEDETLTRDPNYYEVSAVPRYLHDLPLWIQERIAVLRLLDEKQRTPLGGWSWLGSLSDFDIQIGLVRQPGDPKWEE